MNMKKITVICPVYNEEQNIKLFFKKIYVLDGKRNMLKPSIQNVKLMHKFILKIGNKQALFIGDDKIVDKKFAENLGVKYLYFKFKNDV